MKRKSLRFESLEDRTLYSVSPGSPASLVDTVPLLSESALVGSPRACPAPSQTAATSELSQLLEAVQQQYEVPGMVAGILVDGRLTEVAASGVRQSGQEAAVTVNDQFHLGSNGKAITATLAGMLVDRHCIQWTSTIREVFPELSRWINPAYRNVTLEQLLCHRSGLPEMPNETVETLMTQITLPPRLGRYAFLTPLLRESPVVTQGTFAYSNVGYIVAGAMLERVTGVSYEGLMQRLLFQPLGLKSAGFGSPDASHGRQPSGHDAEGNPADYPFPALANPCGFIHMNLVDWATFLRAQMGEPVRGRRLLRPETLEKLQTAYPGTDGVAYAMGWVVLGTPEEPILWHNGSNDYWFATVTLIPNQKFAVLVAGNRGGDQGAAACDALTLQVLQEYSEHTLPWSQSDSARDSSDALAAAGAKASRGRASHSHGMSFRDRSLGDHEHPMARLDFLAPPRWR